MAEKERKPDRRVLKTKKAIRTAFAKLLCEKDLDKITIKDIADTADINRKTFYNYYSGVYQIIDEIENEVVDNFEKSIQDLQAEDYFKNPYKIFDIISDALNQDLDFYGYLLKMNTNVSLVSKIIEILKDKTMENVAARVDADRERLSVLVEYTVSGMVATYKSWFNSDKKLSLREVSDIMGRLWYNGIHDFLGEYLPDAVS